MTVQTTARPVTLWKSRAGDTPAQLAACYRKAAAIITTLGYDPATASGAYEGQHGASITTALRTAASMCAGTPADVADLAEELETRLAGVLYLTGQEWWRTGVRDMSAVPAHWEDCASRVNEPGFRYPTQDEAVAVLGLAARLIEATGGAQ